MDKKKISNLTFFSWNCITLQLKKRELNLVIKSDSDMKMFIKFLVYTLNSLNG